MSISQLYAQTIKQHNQFPCGKNAVFNHTHCVEGYNPSCGDELTLYFHLQDNKQVTNIGFHADACAICTASLSLLCEFSQQKSLNQLRKDIDRLSHAIQHNQSPHIESLKCLSGVSVYKSRINCALLPWQTFAKAIDDLAESAKSMLAKETVLND